MSANLSLIFKLGAGFFGDAYDLFVIDIVLCILENLPQSPLMGDVKGMQGYVSAATSFGAILGMVFFGILGDSFGRLSAILTTGTISAVGSLVAGLCMPSEVFPLIYQLMLVRFLLGIGIGGEYPLSAVMASESSSEGARGRVIAGVFSMQGVGMLASALLAVIMCKMNVDLEIMWRLLLCIGALPAFLAVYLRLKMTETTAFTQTKRVISGKTTDERVTDMWRVIKENRWALIGTSSTWFLLDVTFYGTAQFKRNISSALSPSPSTKPEDIVATMASFSTIISLMAIPGYLCSCWFMDSIGRYRLQVGGFVAMICCYLLMATGLVLGAPAQLNLALFGLAFFFTNFGPNTTTFIIPSEIFPSSVRTTCHGFSAAMGKAGAVLGAYVFPVIKDTIWGLHGVIYLCAGVAFLGLVCTIVFVPKDKQDGESTKDLQGEPHLELESKGP